MHTARSPTDKRVRLADMEPQQPSRALPRRNFEAGYNRVGTRRKRQGRITDSIVARAVTVKLLGHVPARDRGGTLRCPVVSTDRRSWNLRIVR